MHTYFAIQISYTGTTVSIWIGAPEKKELVQLRLCCNSLRQQGNTGLEILQIDNLHR